MTFNSSSSFSSQKELATLGMFACSLTAFPVASLPSDSLLSAAGITRRAEGRTENEHAGRLKQEADQQAAGEHLAVTCRKETI